MKHRHSSDSLSTGLILVGVGLLFLLRDKIDFFPWVLVVIAIGGLPAALSSRHGWAAWQGIFWLVGLAVLFATDSFWPGILILSGLSMLLQALTGKRRGGREDEDVAREQVTTVPITVAPALTDEVAPEPEPASPFEPERGTAPLSRDDLDLLEAELAATVEGEVALATAVAQSAAEPAPDTEGTELPDQAGADVTELQAPEESTNQPEPRTDGLEELKPEEPSLPQG